MMENFLDLVSFYRLNWTFPLISLILKINTCMCADGSSPSATDHGVLGNIALHRCVYGGGILRLLFSCVVVASLCDIFKLDN